MLTVTSTAPILVVAQKVMYHWGTLVAQIATWSPGLHAHSDQGPGKGVHIVAELGICAGVIQSGVAESVLIREFLHHAVEHLRKGEIDQMLLRPNVFAGFPVIVVQTAGFMRAPPKYWLMKLA